MRLAGNAIAAALAALLAGGSAAGAAKAKPKKGPPGKTISAPGSASTFLPPPRFPDLAAAPGAALPAEAPGGSFIFRWPLERIVITSHFGHRKKPTKKKRSKARGFHGGLDFDGDLGEAVFAAGPGRVAHAGWFFGYGNLVVVNHPDAFQTRYGHLSEVHVFIGEMVRAGATLGLVGSTGASTGTHLHFGAYFKGKPVDPAELIGTSSGAFTGEGEDGEEDLSGESSAGAGTGPAKGKGR